MLLPGNCYCWSIILRCIYGGQIFTISNEPGEAGRNIKHYMLRDRKGRVRHFKRVYDVLPVPLCHYLFLGRIESSGKRRRKK